MSARVDVAVVGAGPFGLSVAATLGRRLRARVYGPALETWRARMPRDMLLRSAWEETSLWSGDAAGTIDAWAAAAGEARHEPLPVTTFLRYGAWFCERFVREHVAERVVAVEPAARGYRVVDAAGGETEAGAGVLAPGIVPFAVAPPALAEAVGTRVRFAHDVSNHGALSGRRVVVVGAGQSGLEAAALAAGAGAEVELLARSEVRWFANREPYVPRGPLERRLYRLAYPALGYGPPPLNRLVLHPDAFASLPARLRRKIARRTLRSGGSPWLRSLVERRVRISTGASVRSVDSSGDGLRLLLDDGSEREADDVVVATGFRFDLDRLPFLAPELRARIAVADGWPVLDRGFRSSEPGILFAGYPAEGRFGPLVRFVLGARFNADRIARTLGAGP